MQAAYQAALTQQAAAAQTLLMQQQGGAPFAALQQAQLVGGYSDALAAQVAAQLSLTPGYFNNSNINAAAAAAAAAAVQNIMGEPCSYSYGSCPGTHACMQGRVNCVSSSSRSVDASVLLQQVRQHRARRMTGMAKANGVVVTREADATIGAMPSASASASATSTWMAPISLPAAFRALKRCWAR
jgi:hypothetical protein